MNLPPIELNEAEQRFEVRVDGLTAFVAFRRFPGLIDFFHTLVPPELGGRGIGSALARHVLDYAAEHSLKVIPSCEFIAAYIAKHPQYQPLVQAD